MKTNINLTTIARSGFISWMLFIVVLCLAAFPFAVHAADAVATVSAASPLANVAVTPAGPGSITVTGLPPSWDAIYLKIISILGGVVLVARVIVKLTPTPADDTFLDKAINVLKHLGLSTPTDTKSP